MRDIAHVGTRGIVRTRADVFGREKGTSVFFQEGTQAGIGSQRQVPGHVMNHTFGTDGIGPSPQSPINVGVVVL